MAKISHNLGTLFYLQAKYPEALKYYFIALKVREEAGDSVNIAKSYNNVGLVYYELNNFKECLSYHTRSAAIKEKLHDEYGLSLSYGNIGNLYFRFVNNAGDTALEKSLYYQQKSLEIQERLCKADPDNMNFLSSKSASYNNMGNIFLEKSLREHREENLLKALKFHSLALDIQEVLNDTRGLSHSYINIASVKGKMGNYKGAVSDFELAISICKKAGNREGLKAAYEGISNIYEQTNDFEKSLRYYKLYNAVKDSILNIANSEQISEMSAKFDSDKRAKEIELLHKNQSLKETELKRQTLLRNSFIVGFILVIALIIMLYNRYRLKTQSERKLEEQNKLIAHKNKETTDSIKYAKRIQEAILPADEYVQKSLPDSFIFYKPKDIVSGDFYWVNEVDDKVYFAAVDCTGHGVPGAFISIVGFNLLKHAIHQHSKLSPAEIIDQVNKDMSETLRQSRKDSMVKDGMDISLCCLNKKTLQLQYAGANSPMYLLKKSNSVKSSFDYELKEIKADKQPVGLFLEEEAKLFTNHNFDLAKGDMIYLFTDGFSDQFGGPDGDKGGKKFKYKQFEDLILSISDKPMKDQRKIFNDIFENWRGSNEQVDDILVMGVRI